VIICCVRNEVRYVVCCCYNLQYMLLLVVSLVMVHGSWFMAGLWFVKGPYYLAHSILKRRGIGYRLQEGLYLQVTKGTRHTSPFE